MDEKGDRVGKEPQMSDQDDQEAVMEGKGCEPEPFLPLVVKLGPFFDLEFGVSEKRAEKKHL